jgi:hypothetical protein
VEVSQVRRRVTAAIEQARRNQQQRRERSAETERAYQTFLSEIAVPVTRMVAGSLKADGYPFTVATPGGGLRLTSDNRHNDYIDVGLDTSADPPEVTARINYVRGSRTITDERPVKPGASPRDITEEDFLEFLVKALEPWLEH